MPFEQHARWEAGINLKCVNNLRLVIQPFIFGAYLNRGCTFSHSWAETRLLQTDGLYENFTLS